MVYEADWPSFIAISLMPSPFSTPPISIDLLGSHPYSSKTPFSLILLLSDNTYVYYRLICTLRDRMEIVNLDNLRQSICC